MNHYPWGHNRRFNAYSAYFKKEFGTRVQKVSINAGFSCPNRDGSVSTGGCTFCNNKAFHPSYCNPKLSVTEQIEKGIEFHKDRYKNAGKHIAYFQSFSNTYKPLNELKGIYDQALKHPEIHGLVIGTRPDCINDEKLDYFKELAQQTYVIIEYGIESCYNKTLKLVNRGHTFEQTVDALEKTAERGIKTGGHIILGLPGESRKEMLVMSEILSSLPLNNIKFHQLQIFKDTQMEKQFMSDPEMFELFELEEYIEFIVDFTEKLNPDFVIERFMGEAPPQYVVGGNRWGYRNHQVLSMIENRMEERNTWQGKLF